VNEGAVFERNFVIDSKVYQGFIDIFGDMNPLHTQRDFAVSKGFESEVMFGNILNGFISFFVGECLPVKNVIIQKQVINFKNPVYLNDHLILKAEIVGYHASVNTYEFKYSFIKTGNIIVANGHLFIGIL